MDHVERMRRYAGPVVVEALADPRVTEVAFNPQDGRLWVGRRPVERALSVEQVEMFLNSVAASMDMTIGAATPYLQATLPMEGFRGARLQGFVPPVTTGPAFSIRVPSVGIYSLGDYQLGEAADRVVRECVASRRSIVVAGATNSGKTTFANALLHEMHVVTPADRVVVLEDTAELRPPSRNHLMLRTPPGGTLRELVKATLRVSPDRIVVGEVRDASAFDLLDAWTTGHPGGCATVHAETALGALGRLDRLAGMSQAALVAEAVAVVVVMELRRVAGVSRVIGLDRRGHFVTEDIGR